MNKIVNSYLSIQDWERTANKNGNTRFVNVTAVRRTEISEGTKPYQELYWFENVLKKGACLASSRRRRRHYYHYCSRNSRPAECNQIRQRLQEGPHASFGEKGSQCKQPTTTFVDSNSVSCFERNK